MAANATAHANGTPKRLFTRVPANLRSASVRRVGQEGRRPYRAQQLARRSDLHEPDEKTLVSVYGPKLQAIVDLFQMLPEEEKRENLFAYAEQAKSQGPREG